MENEVFSNFLVTTGLNIDGYHITESKGIVKGIIVRSRSILGNIGASLQTILGGNISLYTQLCEKSRDDAYNLMCQHATDIKANGIISMRYDTNELAPGIAEVLCYGTAVILEKN